MRDDHTAPDGASGEDELRILLRGAVEGIRPSGDALERILHAVPARRRARRRRAVVGAAAAALIAGTAIPAALHLAGGEGTDADRRTVAGHEAHSGDEHSGASDPHQNGYGAYPKAGGSLSGSVDAGGATGQPDTSQGGATTGGPASGPAGTGDPGGPAGSASDPAAGTGPLPPVASPGVPGCGAEQLGVVGYVRNPEGDGRVAGGFRVTNVSSRGCAVTGRDNVTAASAPVATLVPGSGVAVVDHAAGDPGSGLLPDPSAQPSVVVLAPNKSYEVRFAWVPPGEPCAANGSDGGGKPPQTGSAGTSGAPGSGAASEPQTGTPQAPSVVEVSHTPRTSAAPTTRTSIPDACGGTVYRTGAIPVDD
ncbi:hypothetical protein AW27_015330 [Streptomyces sp. PCS3-D2]|uniref:hypothetical protein n=1 Tax=Streptomyces sp. PCS3-D2 TaxID=1460244 RepID=UPI00044EF734|nr:hypothetical protein [Streptomyces sp. PCS3-D2]WKV72781.1 hypothetical protein AW27_015330 [Streptomyces sp. PCS3-D2]